MFIDAIGRLQAQESLQQIEIGQVASGGLKKEAAERVIRRLQNMAGAHVQPLRPTVADLGRMGIGVIFEGRGQV